MAINITTPRKKGGPVDRSYDDPSDVTQIKRCVTSSIKKEDEEYIKHLIDQLEAAKKKNPAEFNANVLAKEQLKKLKEAEKTNQEKPRVPVSGIKSTYDVNKRKELNDLKKTITRYRKERKKTALSSMLTTVNAHLTAHPNHSELTELQTELNATIQDINTQGNYQPYTQLLSAEFTITPRVQQPPTVLPVYKYTERKLAQYLQKPVSAKKKNGQDHLDVLNACFWLDFLKNTGFFAADGDRDNVVYYLVALRNFHSHNASHYPAQGYGLSAREECEQPLYYLRSQTEHHEIRRFKQETGIGKTCLGAQNEPYLKMVLRCATLSTEYRDQLKAVKKNGERGDALKDVTHYGNKITHLGSRANNVASSYTTMERAFDQFSKDNPGELAKLVRKPSHVGTWHEANTKNQLRLLQLEFGKLYHQSAIAYPRAASALMQHRSKQAETIVAQLHQLEQLEAKTATGSSIIYLDLYPNAFPGKRDSQNIKEGLTNVLLGFFGGLLNHNAKQMGLHYFVQRRQSFGFLRDTLTDAGSLRIRLSLGGNPAPFQTCIIKTIKQFDKLLAAFNFANLDQTQAENRPVIEKSQQVYEAARGQQATDNTGNYLLNSMRVVDDQWMALLVAQKLLASNGSTDNAFREYLQKFVIDRAEHKKISATGEYDNKQIKRTGYTFHHTNGTTLTPAQAAQQYRETIIQSNPLFMLLNNLVETTINYVCSLASMPTSVSLYQVLLKLLHHCQKGRAILAHAHEHELSHLQAKATLLIEGIQEYTILLRSLTKQTGHTSDQLKHLDKAKFTHALGLGDSNSCHIFYNDSGQQAINAAMMAMTLEGMDSFHMFNGNYYEIDAFCEDSGLAAKKTAKAKDAAVWVCDITKIQTVFEALPNATPSALIIDITHNSSVAKMTGLKDLVTWARARGIWITLSCSTLKHEQLGQDKYQSGRNIVLTPPGKSLNKQKTEKYLTDISNEAMNPLIAAYRQTVETVTQEAERSALEQHGIFSNLLPQPAPAVAMPAPAQ